MTMENEQKVMQQDQVAQQDVMGQLKKIRSSLRALQDAVILLNDDESLEWWNQAAEDLLLLQGVDKGKSIFDFITFPELRQ